VDENLGLDISVNPGWWNNQNLGFGYARIGELEPKWDVGTHGGVKSSDIHEMNGIPSE
jgi:hypothetical protein